MTAFAAFRLAGVAVASYDARAHLVVARRVLDSLTPGWLQAGVLWLPLPHLLGVLLTWPDALYRNGLGVCALSLAATLGATWHVWRLARRAFANDDLAVTVAVATFALNPNVLYAASTPLTEPLLLYLLLASIDLLDAWRADAARPRRLLGLAGAALGLACATRYEAWPLVPAAAAWVLVVERAGRARGRARARAALAAAAAVSAGGALGIAAVLVHHAYVAGDALAFRALAAGDNVDRGIWQLALLSWGKGIVYHAGVPLAALFGLGAADAARAAAARPAAPPGRAALVLLLLLLLPALVPAVFFFSGHLFRFRYALTAAPAVALFCGWAARRQPRAALAALALHALWLAWPLYPWYRSSLLLESTWHERAEPERAAAAAALRAGAGAPGDTTLVLCSMASLAPLLWESGLPLRRVVHEGNGALRDAALARPRDVVGWIVLEKDDAFARAAAARPGFFEGFVRVWAEGTVEIWRRG